MENQVSLKQISERLAMPIGQLHKRADVLRRCELAEVSFEEIESVLCTNGMILMSELGENYGNCMYTR